MARQTVFAEGARGSCSEDIISKFDLRRGKDMQTYGLGIKEVWRVPQDRLKPGYIQVPFIIHFIAYHLYFSILCNFVFQSIRWAGR